MRGLLAVIVSCLALAVPDAPAFPAYPAAEVQMPSRWNGTLLLFSHGYVLPGGTPSASDAPDPATRSWLLDHGYALAGTSFRNSGWAVEEALQDQMQLLGTFRQHFGTPRKTIAWGGSMGGLVSAALVEQHPTIFDGGMSMCGVMAGAVASWNLRLDSAFVFRTLLAPGAALDLVKVREVQKELAVTRQTAETAETTAAGRARLALAGAVGDLAAWPGPVQDFYIIRRHELETRAAGNPSWNTGVDYRTQLQRSRFRADVVRLYEAARLDLDSDLERLARAPRVTADSKAVAYLSRNVILTGRLDIPFLTVHATGDDQVPAEQEQAYSQAVAAGHRTDLLRQLYVDHPGHCGVRTSEALVALRALLQRLDTGRWPALDPGALNGSGLRANASTPAFTNFMPGPFLRSDRGPLAPLRPDG